MSDMTTFLSAELTEMGLMAAADPSFAERLVDALQRLPAAPDARARDTSEYGVAESDVGLSATPR